MTQTITQQLQLVNIIQLTQNKLSKNFTILLNKLNYQNNQIEQNNILFDEKIKYHQEKFQNLDHVLLQNNTNIFSKFDEVINRVDKLENANAQQNVQLNKKQAAIKGLNKELFNTQLQFQEKIKIKERELDDLNAKVTQLQIEQEILNEEINKKQNKVDAEKIIKQSNILKDKQAHLEGELKIVHHKIEKIQILNEKAERLQARKDIQMLKDIEEKVRRQLKGAPTQQSRGRQSIEMTQSTFKGSFYNDGKESLRTAQEPSRNNYDLIIEKWSDKIKKIQLEQKQMGENIKLLNKESFNPRRTTTNSFSDISSEIIKEKINEIKPELVKLWAKFDTLEDRLAFNQRKLDEKLKVVNEMISLMKENSMSKLEDKIKNLQTQIFTNLKDIRGKIETKVNNTDYQKYCKTIDDRISQLNELIYLKSDKIEVKKALLFLQSKIKEIILVISQDEENEKDALLTKKQIKCISCDKDLDKLNGVVSSPKGNWDSLPYKDHPAEILGRFGMTNFGSLSKKLKKLQGKDLPILNRKYQGSHSKQNSP